MRPREFYLIYLFKSFGAEPPLTKDRLLEMIEKEEAKKAAKGNKG